MTSLQTKNRGQQAAIAQPGHAHMSGKALLDPDTPIPEIPTDTAETRK